MNIDDSDATGGIYDKFKVERCDGHSAPGEKHEACRYFVLDLDHDPHAAPALRAYANSCEWKFRRLAADLTMVAGAIELRTAGFIPPGDEWRR